MTEPAVITDRSGSFRAEVVINPGTARGWAATQIAFCCERAPGRVERIFSVIAEIYPPELAALHSQITALLEGKSTNVDFTPEAEPSFSIRIARIAAERGFSIGFEIDLRLVKPFSIAVPYGFNTISVRLAVAAEALNAFMTVLSGQILACRA